MIKRTIEKALREVRVTFRDEDFKELAERTTKAVQHDLEEGVAIAIEVRCNGIPQ